jgi:hypothetical protein
MARKETVHEILGMIIETNSLPNEEKAECLDAILIKTEKLKIYLRLACDLKIISPGLLGKTASEIETIGTQIGAWKGWAQSIKTGR